MEQDLLFIGVYGYARDGNEHAGRIVSENSIARKGRIRKKTERHKKTAAV